MRTTIAKLLNGRWREIVLIPLLCLPISSDARILLSVEAGKPNPFLEHLQILKRFERSDLLLIEGGVDLSQSLLSQTTVRFAELDQLHELNQANDPRFDEQWHLQTVTAVHAWQLSKGLGATVAVIDTGIDLEHPDLAGQYLAGHNVVSNNDQVNDSNGHGTKVSGVIAALTDNGIGVASVGPGITILPIKVSERADGAAYTSDIVNAIEYAADHSAHVINISYGVSGSRSVQSASAAFGGIVAIAAGNSGQLEQIAASDSVLAVSATTQGGVAAGFTSYGPYVDFAAPGASILTTQLNGYARVSGTSFSAPIVAAAAALFVAKFPNISANEIEHALQQTALDLGAPGFDQIYGHGLIQIAPAMQSIEAPAPDPEPPAPKLTLLAWLRGLFR